MSTEVAELQGKTNRRAQWQAEAKGVREINRGKYWKQKKADLVNEAESILEKANIANRDMTAGEQGWFEKTKADLGYVNGIIAQHDEEVRAYMAKAGEVMPFGGQSAGGVLPTSHSARLARLQKTPGKSGRLYNDLFPNAGDTAGFSSGEEFLRLVASGMSDERILRLNASTHLEGVPSAGGYVVPEMLAREWLDASLENEIVRPRCDVKPMTTEKLKVSGFDVSDMSTSSPFGFRAEWAAENSEATPQIAKFRMITLDAKKLKLYGEASNELVMDGNDFENQVGGAMTSAVGWTLDDACLYSGNGAGQPLSVLNDPALITIPKEPGQAASSLLYENIVRMYSRLHPSVMRGAIWVANSTTIPAMLQMYIPFGTGGAIAPAVKEANSSFSLLGLDLIFTEKLPTLGSKGDLLLVNFSHYVLGLRKEITLEKSNAPGWSRDVMSYRVILRADGMGKWNKPQTPKSGDSRSWCVALAART